MKLKIIGFENEIEFKNNINVLIIIDRKCFSHIIECLNNKNQGIEDNEIYLLDDENNELNMEKNMLIVFDLFNLEYNSKKFLNKIYEIISNNIKLKNDFIIEELIFKLRNYLIEEINELPFEFLMKEEIDVLDILKLFSLKIDSKNYTSILERVELIIDMLTVVQPNTLLVIPNLKLYLSDEEIIELYKYSLYNNINLLVIEQNFTKKLEYENILIIDENFSETVCLE